jgi:fructokinase
MWTTAETETRRPSISGAGFVTLDVTLDDASRVTYRGIGGTTGNVLSILAFFGWRSMPVVRVGSDRIGQAVLREFRELGADVRHMGAEPALETPLIFQFAAQPSSLPRYGFECPSCGKARRFTRELIDTGFKAALDDVSSTNVFFFDRVTPGAVEMAETAREGGAVVFFEPSSVAADSALFAKALRASHVVKYSAERIAGSLSDLLDSGFVEIQTMGAKGLRFRKHSLAPDWVALPALHVNGVADTSGAGDWCSAGFIHALEQIAENCAPQDLSYNEVYESLRMAQAIAALSCQHVGARGLMRATAPDAALSDALRILQDNLCGPSSVGPASEVAFIRDAAPVSGESSYLDLCCQTLV